MRSSLVLFTWAGALAGGGLTATHLMTYDRYLSGAGAGAELLGPLSVLLAVAAGMALLMRATCRGNVAATLLLGLIGARVGLVGFLVAVVLPVGLLVTGETDRTTLAWMLGTAVGAAVWGVLMVRAGRLLLTEPGG